MPEPFLTQSEAEILMQMEKHKEDASEYSFPLGGEKTEIPLVGVNDRDRFILDLYRGKINLAKITYQNRTRQTIVLVRVDLEGGMHANPDGALIPCPHLHVYREGYGDKWATPLPPSVFTNSKDIWQTMIDFMRYCNITLPPNIKPVLF